jgi:hypothetical protein
MNTLKVTTSIFGIILLIGMTVGPSNLARAASGQDAATTNEWTGMVTDSICKGLNVYKAHTQFSCARDCVQLKRADYVLVVGSTIYTLQGNRAEFEKFAGGRATVKGQISGTTIAVESLSEPKKARS